jgi:hypothetical protein
MKLTSLEQKIDASMEGLLKTAAQSPLSELYDNPRNLSWECV